VTASPHRRLPLLAALGALALVLGACSSDEPDDAGATETTQATSAPAETSAAPVSDEPFGAGCAALAADGEGSPAGMADDPVATAASNNSALSSLVQAVTAAQLVDPLNSQEAVTVLAPANPAFAAIPPDQVQALLGDTPRLTAVLTHHVIAGRLAPDQLAGTHTTLNNDEVTIEGEGEAFTITGTFTEIDAAVVCGNVQTANATVYVIDQVLAPPAA
jgi:uncharacterized surface protein with fasciclin (FAS1) repeats